MCVCGRLVSGYVGEVVEVYSRSNRAWFLGEIVETGGIEADGTPTVLVTYNQRRYTKWVDIRYTDEVRSVPQLVSRTVHKVRAQGSFTSLSLAVFTWQWSLQPWTPAAWSSRLSNHVSNGCPLFAFRKDDLGGRDRPGDSCARPGRGRRPDAADATGSRGA